MVRIQAGALAALAAAAVGCGGTGGPSGDRPAVTDGGHADAPDVAAADRLCRRLQDDPPAGVRDVRIRVPGSPSVTCVVR